MSITSITSKVNRSLLATAAVLFTVVVGVPSVAQAGTGTSVTPNIPFALKVGDTGVPASITIGNTNNGNELGLDNTVCNSGDAFPCRQPVADGTLRGDPGINAILSCGELGDGCAPVGADPGVFGFSSTGLGAVGSSCEGVVFDITETDPVYGTLRFVPQVPANVVIGQDLQCQIDFTVSVLKLPVIDADPLTLGTQTIFVADNSQFTIGAQGNLANNATGTDNTTITLNTPNFSTDAGETAIGTTVTGVVGNVILTDTAFVLDRVNADLTGTVSFRLYGPDDADCSGAPIFEDLNRPISNVDDSVRSAQFIPTVAGTYRWIGSYSGDASNAPVSGACNDPDENSLVSAAGPVITTEASADIQLGAGELVDIAVVTGTVLPQPGATVTFNLYGPNDTTCANAPVFTSTVPYPVTGGPVTSAPFTPTTTGDYQWIASYSGDANNGTAVGVCGDPLELSVVTPAAPEILTEASAATAIGGQLSDIARVTGLINPIGSTIDFRLYGPDDATCATAPIFTSLGVPYDAAATIVSSASFTPTVPGTYRWVATYNGDANNTSAVGVCGDRSETTVVSRAIATIATDASPGTFAGDGQALTDTAIVSDRVDPDGTGTIDFRLYGPNDVDCSGTPIYTSLGIAYPAAGGSVASGPFVPTLPGVYRWVATYSGDANNAEVSGICGDPTETVSVAPTPDTTVELPATGQGGVSGTLVIGFGSVLAGAALLGFGRRRRPILS